MSIIPHTRSLVLTKLPKIKQAKTNLKNVVIELNEHAQQSYKKWKSKETSHRSYIVNRVTLKLLNQVGKKSDFLEKEIRSSVMKSLFLLERQQVNVLTPMEAFVDLDVVENPLPLLVMEEYFAKEMLQIVKGEKFDPVWDDKVTNLLSTFPGYNVIAAGKKLHVDYDFPNAARKTLELLGELPTVDDWSKGFAPVIVGLEQTQSEMNRFMPVNLFNIGTRMPLALDQFFYWRNEPLKKFHGEGTVYTYPEDQLLELLRKETKFLPFDYLVGEPPLITYNPEGELQQRKEEQPSDKD